MNMIKEKQTNIHKDWLPIRISPKSRIKIIRRISRVMQREHRMANMTDELDKIIEESKY